MSRWLAHVAVLALFGVSFIPDPVATVHGRYEPAEIEPRLLPTSEPVNLPRATVSTRTTPSPLPTPVAIDPDATPLPGPTEPPPAEPSTQVSGGGTGPVAQPASLIYPVAGTITQYWSAGHPAVDIASPYGTPLIAPHAGTVTFSGWANNGGGYQVHIDHGWGVTGLHHLSAVYLRPGTQVAAGTVVGAVGCTGICTGPHVHWSLLVDGWYRNPLAYL